MATNDTIKIAELKAIHNEERYVEFDETFELYGVFGIKSGFCYSQHYTFEEANKSKHIGR